MRTKPSFIADQKFLNSARAMARSFLPYVGSVGCVKESLHFGHTPCDDLSAAQTDSERADCESAFSFFRADFSLRQKLRYFPNMIG